MNPETVTQYILKILLTVGLVVAVSEVSKRSTFVGGLLASLPLVSILALLWLYVETHDLEKVASLSTSILWLVMPSLVLFMSLPLLLRAKFGFYSSLAIASALMLVAYAGLIALLKSLGVKL